MAGRTRTVSVETGKQVERAPRYPDTPRKERRVGVPFGTGKGVSMRITEEAHGRATRTTAPLKVDAAIDELIADGAHFLGMTKKDLVAKAVRTYLEIRREEVRASMLEKMRKLDGSVESSVSLLTGMSPERIKELGGVGEDD